MGDTNGELGSDSFPSPLNAMPLRQLPARPQSTLETSTPQQQTVGVSTLPRTRKMKSPVWTHFVKLVINGEQKAKCLHCHRMFSGNSKNGTSHLKDHMTRRCPRKFSQVGVRQKLMTFSRKQDSTLVRVVNHDERSRMCLDGENEHVLSGDMGFECGVVENSTPIRMREVVVEPKVVIECHSDGHEHEHEHAPVCVDGASQCSEQECGSLGNLVVKASYKDDTVRFDFPPTSSVDELEKEVAKNLKLALSNFKMKYQDEDKEWMLMTMDSHLSYVLSLTKSSGSNVVRLLVSDL